MADGRLAGQIALVTGASSGIGRAIALGYARAGADVIVHYRTRTAEAEAVADAIRALGQRAQVVRGDIASAAEVAAFMVEAEALVGVGADQGSLRARLGADEGRLLENVRPRAQPERRRHGQAGRWERRNPAAGSPESRRLLERGAGAPVRPWCSDGVR